MGRYVTTRTKQLSLYVNIYIYVYIYIYIYIYIYMNVYTYIHVQVSLSLSLSLFLYIYIYICSHMFVYERPLLKSLDVRRLLSCVYESLAHCKSDDTLHHCYTCICLHESLAGITFEAFEP